MRTALPLVCALAALLLFQGLSGVRRASSRPLFEGLDRLARESGVQGFTGGRLVASCASVALLALLGAAGLTGSLAPAVALAVGAGWGPIALARSRATRRRHQLRESWPDAIATLVAGVRAGISLPEACAALARSGPREIREPIAAFASTYHATGSFTAALYRLRTELSDPVGDRVVAALSMAHEVGGTDLVRTLRTLGDFVREDLRVRKEIEARWSWTVTAARVAAAAPWVVLLMMSTRPEAAVAYDSSTGALVIAAGALATVVGYRLMLRAARLPEERRLLG